MVKLNATMEEREEIVKEYQKILEQLSDPELISDWQKFENLSMKKTCLEKFFDKEREIQEIKNKIEENKTIILANEDYELVTLAESEISQLRDREKILEKELNSLREKIERWEKENNQPEAVIVEIRAGTGGEEASLFAADLFKMYLKYAENQNWKVKIFDSRPTELGGLKEIIFEIKGKNVFSRMKYEAGVHRVQRIPKTEKSGRIHTSTATVAVLPKPKKSEIKINHNDLKIETYKASGPGGQYVNKRMTAVRITHLPTGMIVSSQSERNLQQNKENAMSILEARLLEKKEITEMEKLSEKRRAQIGWARRCEKIRTYNFPQERVTDHRIKRSWHNLEEILNGKIDLIFQELQKEENKKEE